mmetsp:Transcript_57153/g.170373  ORF Transcript_57153/g.170373 Transcript_57153/m.170373 type:complete len:318 (-) Transcript_57153:265-1218(-)
MGRPSPRKLLFSATLTKDPRKLASLGLVNPRTYDARALTRALAEERGEGTNGRDGDADGEDAATRGAPGEVYTLPDRLEERYVSCRAEQKPLVLLALLLELIRGGNDEDNAGTAKTAAGATAVIVFTSSIDSTHRLARLLQLLWATGGHGDASAVAEFSSALNRKQRSRLLRRCAGGGGHGGKGQGVGCVGPGVSVLVCSDGMSRGMDLPSVRAVIHYDVPRYAKTYVHRCGRTARAGRRGTAWTILKSGQERDFHRMRDLIDRPGNVEEGGVRKELVRGSVAVYGRCVRTLRKVVRAEEGGELDAGAPLSLEWLSA